MAENVTSVDETSSGNPTISSDTGDVPVATEARDMGSTSQEDTAEPPVDHSNSDVPEAGEASQNDAVVERSVADAGPERPALDTGFDSNHALDAQTAQELIMSPEGFQPEETTTTKPTLFAGSDGDDMGLSVAKPPVDDGGSFFDELDQQQSGGAAQDPFADPASVEPPVDAAVQEPAQPTTDQEDAANAENHKSDQQQQPFATNGDASGAGNAFWRNSGVSFGDGEGDVFDQLKTQTKPIYMPPEPESRFEEGVPLLKETTQQAPVQPPATNQPEPEPTSAVDAAEPTKTNAEPQVDSIFAGDEDEGADFFSQVQQPAQQPDFPPIERKDTPQVMDSVGEPLDSPIPETSPSVEQFSQMLAVPSSGKQMKKASSEEDLVARWQAELSDNEELQEPTEEDLAARWQAELDDDDDDLLMDGFEDNTIANGQEQQPAQSVPDTTSHVPSSGFNVSQGSRASSSYTPHQPSTPSLLQSVPLPATQPFPPPSSYFEPQGPPRPGPARAESFTTRSKEGYKSPYDVPEVLSRPKRPARPVVAAPGPALPANTPPIGSMGPPPPPRSSSIPAPPTASPFPPPPMGASPHIGSASPAPAAAPPLAPSKSFYEELPLPPPRSRSRPASSGRYTPNPNAAATATAPVPAPVGASHAPPPPQNPYSSVAPPPPQPPNEVPGPPQEELSQVPPPEQSEPYVNSLAPPPAPPSVSSRYSPKPPGLQPGTKPPSTPRYSPAPPPSSAGSSPRTNRYVSQPTTHPPGPAAAALPFQPRTSSPLAYHEKVSYQPDVSENRPSLEPSANLSPPNRFRPRPSLDQSPPQMSMPVAAGGVDPSASNVDVQKELPPPPPQQPPLANQQHVSSPRTTYTPPSYVNGFAPENQPPSGNGPSFPAAETPDAGGSQFVPPRRSQTQSPSQQIMMGPKLSVPSIDPLQRPASVHGSGSPTKTISQCVPSQVSARSRAASMHLNFVPPVDEQQMDPLERWKGAPIIKFGFGGSVTSCFPMRIPRYTAGQAAPLLKSCPGEVKTCQLNDWLPPAEGIVAHPGPLKNKSKKKEVLNWLSSKIAAFENEGLPEGVALSPDSQKRHEEKILLWKIIRVLVEKDGGALEGSAEIQKALRDVIYPHLQNAETDQVYGGSVSQPMNAPAQSDAVDPRSIDTIRDNLVLGDREKAVWSAVDNRLWGHAMIISSTLDKSLWKQVVQEFVRREVRSATGNTEPLAALYEIFAGNVEESVDELVPPSARAGLQMVSTVNGQDSLKKGLDGLDSWKDTLGMVLSNRSPEDFHALMALGRLLHSYGRVEAAHICMIFSRVALFGGADDPQASIVLLGADHQHFPFTFMQDEDAILLTEVYEFATSILASLPQATLPHLTGFKLQYAWTLAERGRKAEAQQYCDAITAALKASTKPSGYYHQNLFATLDELSARLRQATTDGGSSWITKPTMEKMSGSMWAKFSNFVSGEESDAASTGSGKGADADIGPFAKVTGTPTVSRSPSVADFYGGYPANGAQPIPAHGGASRYHPTSQYEPNSSPEQFRGRGSMDSQRSLGFGYGRRGSQEPAVPGDNNSYFPSGPIYSSPLAGYQSTPPQSSYMPLAPVEEDLSSQAGASPAPMHPDSLTASPYQPQMYTPETYSQPFGGAQGTPNPPQSGFGYMPPGVGGGESYGPPVDETGGVSATHEEDEYAEEERPKKSMMDDDDDDDDIAARSAALQKAEKERQDREAAETFKKAAEEDGKHGFCLHIKS